MLKDAPWVVPQDVVQTGGQKRCEGGPCTQGGVCSLSSRPAEKEGLWTLKCAAEEEEGLQSLSVLLQPGFVLNAARLGGPLRG